jgi:hypothetical protein
VSLLASSRSKPTLAKRWRSVGGELLLTGEAKKLKRELVALSRRAAPAKATQKRNDAGAPLLPAPAAKSRKAWRGNAAKPRPPGEKTMKLGPGPRERTQGSGLTL